MGKIKKNYRLYNHGGLGIGFMVALAQIFLHCTPPNYNSRYLCVFDKLIDEGSFRKITYPFNYHWYWRLSTGKTKINDNQTGVISLKVPLLRKGSYFKQSLPLNQVLILNKWYETELHFRYWFQLILRKKSPKVYNFYSKSAWEI